ncbi:hypothetical protein N0824_02276 [Microcystis sp. 0824]|uniref:hypothetical protein n=1 Tax=Microcystis sp. 0824 TaxID=1502726 RepID=UPI000D0C21A9|nr:hypothetical protein [Microcystis sp. 0824]GBF54409.1 hypothetical protein N0824_02276 [Microcystis sp. 0824]
MNYELGIGDKGEGIRDKGDGRGDKGKGRGERGKERINKNNILNSDSTEPVM